MGISVRNVEKHFGKYHALDNINLEIPSGKLVALLGPSGSGKSTLLRAIAGLEPPDSGQIIINGQDTTHLDIRKRNIGFVFQSYALFKHLTVRQNIAFGLELRKASPNAIKSRVEELLNLIQLQGFADRYPAQLSGGQRQRVALARALAVEPQVLLLDEPFGALDAKVRKELRAGLRKLHEEVHVTTVIVTHDQEEAMEVADEIVILDQGRIEQVGSPAEIYDHPATPFVLNFIGEVNTLPSTAPIFEFANNRLPAGKGYVRPHEVDISLNPEDGKSKAKVERLIHLGREIQVELVLPDQSEIIALLTRDRFKSLNLKVGQEVYVKPQIARFFDANHSGFQSHSQQTV
jgi:sulfate transport system ATP-binding protein